MLVIRELARCDRSFTRGLINGAIILRGRADGAWLAERRPDGPPFARWD
jgi:hypothetical protein